MTVHRTRILAATALVLAGAPALYAQVTRSPANDSLFRRAKRLVADGRGSAGRALIDSVLKSVPEGSPGYGDALYWRGALAETAADAERDYRKVIVEYPVSAYADNALLAMADLESARGDKASALQHLSRFVREHDDATPLRGTAALTAARLAFEERDTRTACTMVAAARSSTPNASVEVKNQVDYLASRCNGVDVASTAQPAAAPPPASPQQPVRDTTPRMTSRPEEPQRVVPRVVTPPPVPVSKQAPRTAPEPAPVVPKGKYTVQLAALNTQRDADALVARFKTRGVIAHVSHEGSLFRVQLEPFPSHQAAQDEKDALGKRGIVGFVTTVKSPAPTP